MTNAASAVPGSTPWQIEFAERDTELRSEVRKELISVLTVGGVALLLFFVGMVANAKQASTFQQIASWTGAAFFLLATVGTWSSYSDKKLELQKHRAKRLVYEQLHGQKTVAASEKTAVADGAGDEDYFRNLVTINVTNLKDYYYLVKTHTQASFRTSLGVGIVGFAFVIAGLVIGFNGGNANAKTIGVVSTIAGIITEFISGVFFYLYNRTVRQLKEYHDSLLDVQDVLLALKVLEGLQDPATKSEVVKSVVTYLMEGSRKLRATTLASSPSATI